MHMRMHTHAYACMCTLHTHMHVHVHKHMYTNTNTNMHTHTHTHTHTHMHMHGQVVTGDKAAQIDISKVTHFVVNTKAVGNGILKRSMKLCLAISAVQDIVTEGWMLACETAKQFVAVQPYILSGTFSSPAGSKANSMALVLYLSPLP